MGPAYLSPARFACFAQIRDRLQTRLGNLVYHKLEKMVHNRFLCITGETQDMDFLCKSSNQKKNETLNPNIF